MLETLARPKVKGAKMTEREAIGVLNRVVTSGNRLKAISMGIRALKRDEAYKITYKIKDPLTGLKWLGKCPVCEKGVMSPENYCSNCGQRLSWDD